MGDRGCGCDRCQGDATRMDRNPIPDDWHPLIPAITSKPLVTQTSVVDRSGMVLDFRLTRDSFRRLFASVSCVGKKRIGRCFRSKANEVARMIGNRQATVEHACRAETAVVRQCAHRPPCAVSAQLATQCRPAEVSADCQEAHRAEKSDSVGQPTSESLKGNPTTSL